MVRFFLHKIWNALKSWFNIKNLKRAHQLRRCKKGDHQIIWVSEPRYRSKGPSSILNRKGRKKKNHGTWVIGGYDKCQVCGKKLSSWNR